MSDDLPVTGNPVFDGMTRVFDWLGRQIEQVVPRPAPPRRPAPADMTDEQLLRDIHDVGGTLLNRLGPVIERSFAEHGATMGDRRFRHAIPTTVRGHVLMMVTQATDSYGLALLGLRQHATASALGPMRNIAETYAWAKWLLESPDDQVRLGRAYRLTMNGIHQFRDLGAALERIAPQSEQTRAVAPRLAAAANRMDRSLTRLAQDDGVILPAKPRISHLIEQHLPDFGGYMLYGLLSNAGVHPGAARAHLFYGRPGTGVADFDFKGLYHVRAYWIGQNIALHLGLCHLAAPVLGWDEWDAMAAAIEGQLQPLAEEANRRFSEPLLQAMATAPDPLAGGE